MHPDISQFYLELVRKPFLARPLMNAYTLTGNGTAMRPGVPQGSRVIEAAEPQQSAGPKVQLTKAALYFEKAQGFGDWRIIVSTGAKKRLQKLANNDREKCVVVVKKIKYVVCLPSFKPRELTGMAGNFRMDNFPTRIRGGLMHPLEYRSSRPKYSRIFTLL